MKYYSTNQKSHRVTFSEAVVNGLAPDGGLYMPSEYPALPRGFFENIGKRSFRENSFLFIRPFTPEIPDADLIQIINKTLTFDAPLVELENNLSVLELFHGPTFAFKDFGARFLARTLAWINREKNREITILVATSGDTGSAVASGFFGVEGLRVCLLYPSGKVSHIQEQQLTTMGGNVTALEVDGSFDDCQRMVKQAFVDPDLFHSKKLTSANSINIARLLPQSFYYLHTYTQLRSNSGRIRFCVPSGNFGNLTAGLIAKKCGMPVDYFIAAVNANAVFSEYLRSGKYKPRASQHTHSNAMDVGDPSNFVRILELYTGNFTMLKNDIRSVSISDSETVETIKSVYGEFNYIIDPHTAVGVAANFNIDMEKDLHTIVLATAHPAKFSRVVSEAIQMPVPMPEQLAGYLKRKKHSIKINARFGDLKEFLLYS